MMATRGASDWLSDAVLAAPLAGRTTNVFESTVEHLATAIRLGVFATGEQLPPERDLAATLGVSRVTVRECIAALRDSGLVETRRGRGGGTVVTWDGPLPDGVGGPPPSPRQVADVLDFRRIVESGAARLAARCELTASQRRWLNTCAAEVAAAREFVAHRQADARLHLAVAAVTENAPVLDAVTRAQAGLDDLLIRIPSLPRNIEHSDAQHAAVVAAILAGDARGAQLAMEEHCDATSALLRGLIG